jgi:EAL domain-containing protein (putative c-di-GMP-specific phosphodiesterase class I)/FixJ family two-component response regulator
MSTQSIPVELESLLIVDDSPVQRQHAAALCRELGIKLIYEASNGAEALQLLSMLVLLPSAMIIDLEMPGMDGVELIQQLKQQGLTIALIVASSRESVLIESVKTMSQILGMTVLDGLQKPLRLPGLRSALARYCVPGSAAPLRQPAVRDPIDRAELARAIDAGEILPYYQPKVDMRTGIVRGAEALARWQHPVKGLVPPDHFIAQAEQQGLIHALTLSMMEQVLRQATIWNGRGLELSIAVNISAQLLDSPDIVQEISTLLERHALPATQIILEITEGTAATRLGPALGVLARIRLKGFGLSIDDYGTGFSSMQQLARIPFTELKIDRSFVHGAHQRKNSRVILQSALDLARRLELITVAEGIETMEDWRLLQEFGCMIGQGYLIAKPMPADALPQWMKSHNSRLHELRAEPPALALQL